MVFNRTVITDAAIESAKQFYINNAKACIKGAEAGEFHVNDLESWIAWQNERIAEMSRPDFPMSVAFMQRAYYEQTGESVALLP